MTAGLRNATGVLRKVCRTFPGAVGLVIVALVLACAVFAPWVATHNPDALDVMNRFAAPSGAHWLGTDHLGRDLFSRMVHGASVAMQVAVVSIAASLTLGTALGILAAYLPARSERFVLIVFDVISSFPSLVLALAVVAVFGPSTQIVILIVSLSVWQWGFDVAKALLPRPWVPKILDPYFISKPTAIWASFLKLGCLADPAGFKACFDGNANNVWLATVVTLR